MVINLTTMLMFALDKWKAKHDRWRIPEATLLIFAALGGSIGLLCGMKLFHHKTQHKKFTIGVPVILVIQIAAILAIILILLMYTPTPKGMGVRQIKYTSYDLYNQYS